MKLLQFFEDDHGRLSAMRLYSLIALFLAVFLSLKASSQDSPNMELILIWVAAAFAPKVVQKIIEKVADKKLGN